MSYGNVFSVVKMKRRCSECLVLIQVMLVSGQGVVPAHCRRKWQFNEYHRGTYVNNMREDRHIPVLVPMAVLTGLLVHSWLEKGHL
jgi:hypothetical protein